MTTNMRTPKPGTYPSMSIQEGSHGPNDPALKNWDKTFGARTCGACVHYPGAGLPCKVRKPTRLVEQSGQEACFSAFERNARALGCGDRYCEDCDGTCKCGGSAKKRKA